MNPSTPRPSHLRSKKKPRTNRVSIMLNDSELRMLQRYCDRFDVKNRSQLIREALMRSVCKELDRVSPTLFD